MNQNKLTNELRIISNTAILFMQCEKFVVKWLWENGLRQHIMTHRLWHKISRLPSRIHRRVLSFDVFHMRNMLRQVLGLQRIR